MFSPNRCTIDLLVTTTSDHSEKPREGLDDTPEIVRSLSGVSLFLQNTRVNARMGGMNRRETAEIVHMAAKLWAVRTDRQTIDAWAVALTGTHYADARLAVRQLAGERKTIHPADVVKRAHKLRTELLQRIPEIVPPRELADNPRLYIAWQRTATERALDVVRAERDNDQLALPA